MQHLPREKIVIVSQKQHYIDAVRGWAVLLVITSHVGGMFAELPTPVKNLTNFGWSGVQLFFLASAVTLMMSWNNDRQRDAVSSRRFFIRRFLRIAPMYYVGAIIYFIAEPPSDGFSMAQLIPTLTFINAWKPEWVSTTNDWIVVPGGWSIGVEFTFYAIFPLAATSIRSLRSALGFLLLTVIAASLANAVGPDLLSGYTDRAANQFLYYWFPNQLPIFALGIVLYFCIDRYSSLTFSRQTVYGASAIIVVYSVWLAEQGFSSSRFGFMTPLPLLLLVSLGFFAFICILSKAPATLVTHPVIQYVGKLSFSAYILHFLFVHGLTTWYGGLVNARAESFDAIGQCALLWLLSVPCTIAAAAVANALVENPAIDFARRLTARSPRLQPAE